MEKAYITNKVRASVKWVLPFYLLTLLPLFTACDDYLDVTPSDKQTAAQVFASKEGFYTAANGDFFKTTAAIETTSCHLMYAM